MSHGPQWHAGPPWSSDHGRPWAHRSLAERPLRDAIVNFLIDSEFLQFQDVHGKH
jgi:hypothetical protein